jgi:hypothetical protein
MKVFFFCCVSAKKIMRHTQCACVRASLRVVHDLAEVAALLFLSMCAALWIDDMVLNFCSIIFWAKKSHPWFHPFDWQRMNLQRSDMLSLSFGSVTMSSAFGDAAKIYALMLHTAIRGGTPFTRAALNIGTYIQWDWGDTHLRRCIVVWTVDVVLDFFHVVIESKSVTPTFDRLTDRG